MNTGFLIDLLWNLSKKEKISFLPNFNYFNRLPDEKSFFQTYNDENKKLWILLSKLNGTYNLSLIRTMFGEEITKKNKEVIDDNEINEFKQKVNERNSFPVMTKNLSPTIAYELLQKVYSNNFNCEKLKIFIYNSFSDLDVLFSFLIRIDLKKNSSSPTYNFFFSSKNDFVNFDNFIGKIVIENNELVEKSIERINENILGEIINQTKIIYENTKYLFEKNINSPHLIIEGKIVKKDYLEKEFMFIDIYVLKKETDSIPSHREIINLYGLK